VALGLVLLLTREPEVLATGTREPVDDTVHAGSVLVELAEPVDRVDQVELNWSATRELDFAIVVAEEGERPTVMLAERNRSMVVPVVPGRRYCFQVRATDSDQVYESEPVSVRGATCPT
jgi:eukaryotic-like serine/threonine-protein kinase